jgi:hypothetical protein
LRFRTATSFAVTGFLSASVLVLHPQAAHAGAVLSAARSTSGQSHPQQQQPVHVRAQAPAARPATPRTARPAARPSAQRTASEFLDEVRNLPDGTTLVAVSTAHRDSGARGSRLLAGDTLTVRILVTRTGDQVTIKTGGHPGAPSHQERVGPDGVVPTGFLERKFTLFGITQVDMERTA